MSNSPNDKNQDNVDDNIIHSEQLKPVANKIDNPLWLVISKIIIYLEDRCCIKILNIGSIDPIRCSTNN